MTTINSLVSLFFFIFFVLVSISAPDTITAADFFEKPAKAKYSASAILKPEMVRGKFHKVNNRVTYDGFLYHFTVQSVFGPFELTSITSLAILIHELEAIAAMRQVETSDTFKKAMQKSGENTATGIKNLVNDPEGAIRGAGHGISSLFSRVTETVGRRELTETEDSRMEQLIGVSKAKGEIATRYGVNIYSRNKILQEELDRLAMADYLGGIGVGLATSAVPGVGGLLLTTSSTARLLNEAINTTSASELWLQNKNKLLAMGMDADTIELFLNNPVFTPAMQTVVVAALKKMKTAPNRELFLKVGLQASTPDMAKVVSEMTVMAAGYHKHISPLKGFTPMARLLKAKKSDGTVVIFLPIDHMIWNQRVASITAEIVQQGMNNDAAGFELWILGTFSDQARSSLKSMGWLIHEHARNDFIPK